MKSFVLTLTILTLAAGAAQADARHSRPAAPRHRTAYHHSQHARHVRLTAEMRDDGRQAGSIDRIAPRPDGDLDPSITGRFGKDAFASFGYQPGVIRPALQPGELDGAADTRLSHAESVAGVKVGIPF